MTAVLLFFVLAHDLASNLRSRWSDSSHRADDAAINVAQMAQGLLRSSANALIFIAEASRRFHPAAPLNDTALKGLITTVLKQQSQIGRIVVVDTAKPDNPWASLHSTSTSPLCNTSVDAATVICFDATRDTAQGLVIPVAAAIDGRQWVVGEIRVAVLKRAIERVVSPDNVAFSLRDTQGRLVLQGGHDLSAENVKPGWVPWLIGSHIPPLQATVPIGPYPFFATAQISLQDIWVPWRNVALGAISFYVFYLVAFACLLKIIMGAAKLQRHYIQSLQAKTQHLRLAQRAGKTALWSLSDSAQRFECYEEAGDWFGLRPGQTLASANDVLTIVVPADRLLLATQVRRAWKKAVPLRVEFCIQKPEGVVRRLSACGQMVTDETGAKQMVGTVVDVTEQWSVWQRHIESQHRFKVLFEQNPLPFWVFDASSKRFLEVNAAAVRVYGYTREEFLQMTIFDIRDTTERLKVWEDLASPPEVRNVPKLWVHRTKGGTAIDVRIHSVDIVFADRPARLVLAEDVTTQLADERELAYRASHDLITGLPNQHALIQWMDVLIAKSTPFEVAYLQLVGMDAIADTFGIPVATGVLQTVASRLITESNECTAMAAEQAFVWATPNQIADAHMRAVADSVAEPIHYKDTQHQINVVIGIARYPSDGIQSDVLLAHAALAAHAHLHSDETIHYFEPLLAQQSREKLHFAACLRRAVKHHEFELHFQVLTDLHDMRPIGLEALIRWPQTDGTFISPSTFIPICEESGLITSLGHWVMTQAAKAVCDLKSAGFEGLPVAINISPAELLGRDLIASFRAVREAYSLPSGALRVEVTESSLITHKDKAVAVMRQLRADGIAIALDDFGTGFSSLSYLRDLPIDALKIDQAFVRNVDCDERSAMICETIIALGKSLKIDVIAEGIEHYAQYAWLQHHGCDAAQGYFLGKPGPLQDVLKTLSQSTLKRRSVP
ncbi:phosphodiesterase [Dyella monticola]|uniref:Phosphodiesterase n=1 Tax=Dyella monticola TaxID=1927958 RepID=A0A370WS51_9GAMM|nr:phosphodiesterase [Dyella monticola]